MIHEEWNHELSWACGRNLSMSHCFASSDSEEQTDVKMQRLIGHYGAERVSHAKDSCCFFMFEPNVSK